MEMKGYCYSWIQVFDFQELMFQPMDSGLDNSFYWRISSRVSESSGESRNGYHTAFARLASTLWILISALGMSLVYTKYISPYSRKNKI